MALIFNGMEDIGLLALRLFVGWVFIYHGLPKMMNGRDMAKNMGKPGMGGFMIFLGFAELIGGIAAVLGFLTEIAMIGFFIIMLGAIHMKITKFKVPFSSMKAAGWVLDFVILGAVIALAFLGAGSISIDALMGFYP